MLVNCLTEYCLIHRISLSKLFPDRVCMHTDSCPPPLGRLKGALFALGLDLGPYAGVASLKDWASQFVNALGLTVCHKLIRTVIVS